MAYYAYKEVRDLIPDWFRDEYIAKIEAEGGEYVGDSNYDGDMWSLTAEYIHYLLYENLNKDTQISLLLEGLNASSSY
jgi:hypothetical protein